MRYALKFGYNGRGFSGYARQPDLRTVEGEIIRALKNAAIVEDPEKAYLRSGSRTDKGVSARGNVLALNTDFRRSEIIGAANARLKDIWFYAIADVKSIFNPRHAKKRWYRYYLYNENIDVKKIKEASQIFEGEHDFSNFARVEGESGVRTLESVDISEEGDFIILDFKAQSFLWHMVRGIVAALVEVAAGNITSNDIRVALDPSRKVDYGNAPAEPLILMDVQYDFDFQIDKKHIEKLKRNIRDHLIDMKTESTILEQMLSI